MMKTENRTCARCGKATAPADGGVEVFSGRFVCFDCLKNEYVIDCDPDPKRKTTEEGVPAEVRDLRRQCVFTIAGKTEFPTRDTRMGEFRDEWDRLTRSVKGWDASCDRWDFYGNFEISVLDEDLWEFYGVMKRHGMTVTDVQCNWRSAPASLRERIVRAAGEAVEYRSRPYDGKIMFDYAWDTI